MYQPLEHQELAPAAVPVNKWSKSASSFVHLTLAIEFQQGFKVSDTKVGQSISIFWVISRVEDL